MKKLFVLFTTILFLAACNSNPGNKNDIDSDDKNEGGDKKISSRDYSITPANAYNDIFLDSNTVAAFIDTLKADDKVKRRILSFYNARNYQFAWFSGDGLTEQARGFWNLYHYNSKYMSDSLLKDKKLAAKMDNLFAEEEININASEKSSQQTELKLTHLFIEHGLEMYEKGYVKRKEMERFIPLKKTDAIKLADSILSKKHKDGK